MANKTTGRKRPIAVSDISIGSRGLDPDSLRSAIEAEPKAAIQKIQGLIDDGQMSWGNVRHLPSFYRSLRDVEVEVQKRDAMDPSAGTRAVMASAFQVTASGMTIAGVNAAFEAVPTIGQDICTDMEDNKKVTTIAGIVSNSPSVPGGVKEGDIFPEIGAGDEKYQILHLRDGRSLKITAEMISENDIAGIVERTNALGEIAAEIIEEQTIRRVFDVDGSDTTGTAEPFVLHGPDGVGRALYVQNNNAPLTRLISTGNQLINNALVDTTDLEAARARLAGMKNSRGKRIMIPNSRMQLVVPDALVGTALKILGSELEPGVRNELNNWGPRGRYRPQLISSPKIDDISTTAYLVGDCRKQFRRKWKLMLEAVSLAADQQQAFLDRRIAAQFRLAWDVEIGAVDYVYVVQCLSGTASPTP